MMVRKLGVFVFKNKGVGKAPYLLKNIAIRFPNQVWATDIAYIPMGCSHMYPAAIIDWHSRYIVGRNMYTSTSTARPESCRQE
jgi:transposase InsO family protein